MLFDLTNKTTIVTGAGSGIGKEIAMLFAKCNATVYILDVDKKGAEATQQAIVAGGGKAIFRHADITSAQQVEQIIAGIVADTGKLDIIINNAGVAHIGNIEQAEPADLDRLIAVNIKGVYHVIRSAIPHLKKQGGVILNLSSVAALVGLSDRFAYTMTKGAVGALTLSVAKDYLKYNIRCNSISPARVHTPFVDGYLAKNYPGKEEEMFRKLEATQPVGRMAKPVEIAYLALYLCSNEAAFITGCDYPIDGGFTTLNN